MTVLHLLGSAKLVANCFAGQAIASKDTHFNLAAVREATCFVLCCLLHRIYVLMTMLMSLLSATMCMRCVVDVALAHALLHASYQDLQCILMSAGRALVLGFCSAQADCCPCRQKRNGEQNKLRR